MTSTTLKSIQGLESCLNETSDIVDINIKVCNEFMFGFHLLILANIQLMYKIIANCEELNRSLSCIETLSERMYVPFRLIVNCLNLFLIILFYDL